MKQIKQLKYNSVVRCLKYSPDKKRLVVGAYDKIRILDEHYELVKEIEHKIMEFQQICFNQQGDQMAAVNNGLLKVWNSSHFTIFRTLQLQNQATRIEFTPDDQYLICFNQNNPSNVTILQTFDYSIVLYNWTIEGQLYKSSFSRDCKYWAVSSYQQQRLAIYNTKEKIQIKSPNFTLEQFLNQLVRKNDELTQGQITFDENFANIHV